MVVVVAFIDGCGVVVVPLTVVGWWVIVIVIVFIDGSGVVVVLSTVMG